MLLLRVGMFGQAEDFRQWRTHNVIDNAPQASDFFNVIQLPDLHDIVFVLDTPRHSAGLHDKPSGISGDGLFEADLRAISKTRDHGGILAPLLSEAFLRGWVAIGILKALDVA